MKKRIIAIILILVMLFVTMMGVSAEEIIRYSEEYQAPIGTIKEIPSNDVLKEWYNIDLPIDNDNNEIYQIEFDTSNVEIDKVGEYDIPVTYYKDENNKYEKTFKLKIINPVVETSKGKIKAEYLEHNLKTIIIIILIIMIIVTLFDSTEVVRVAVVKNNKFVKVLTLKNKFEYDQKIAYILKKLKLDNISNAILINKEDLNATQINQIKTNKKYKFALFIQ